MEQVNEYIIPSASEILGIFLQLIAGLSLFAIPIAVAVAIAWYIRKE